MLLQRFPLSEDSRSMRQAPCIAAGPYPVVRCPAELARRAARALIEEAELTPKPGLVDGRGPGAHHDLSLQLLVTSAHVLEPYFRRMAEEAKRERLPGTLRIRLGKLGREAEHAMLRATKGINTHRGAIWSLGLLVAGAARLASSEPARICHEAARIARWPDEAGHRRSLSEEQPWRLDAEFGARREAFRAFPHVQFAGLPALARARNSGVPESFARIDALLAIMADLSDTCILRRGGELALYTVQHRAKQILALGGSCPAGGAAALQRLEQTMLALWVSPGGSADLLAATLFLDGLTVSTDALP